MQILNSNALNLKNKLLNIMIEEEAIFIWKLLGDGNSYFRTLSFFFVIMKGTLNTSEIILTII